MLLLDSSGRLEYFTDGPLTSEYSKYLKDLTKIITPTIVFYEVFKKN